MKTLKFGIFLAGAALLTACTFTVDMNRDENQPADDEAMEETQGDDAIMNEDVDDADSMMEGDDSMMEGDDSMMQDDEDGDDSLMQDDENDGSAMMEDNEDNDDSMMGDDDDSMMEEDGGEGMMEEDGNTVEVNSQATVTTEVTSDSSAKSVIHMTASNWQFSPNMITVSKGQEVVIELEGVSGTHGFFVPDLGINVPISAGETKMVEIPTDQAGTFDFRCNIPCGEGHSGMMGRIVITE